MVLSRAAVHRVVEDAPGLVPGAAGRAAIADILSEATRGLLRLTGLLIIVAALVVGWALFQRRQIGSDLLYVGAVVLGLAVVVVLGLSIGSLLLGAALAVAAVAVRSAPVRVTASGGTDHLTPFVRRSWRSGLELAAMDDQRVQHEEADADPHDAPERVEPEGRRTGRSGSDDTRPMAMTLANVEPLSRR